MKKTLYIILLLCFILLNALVYGITELSKRQRINAALEKHLDTLEIHYKLQKKYMNENAKSMYRSTMIVAKIIDILSQAVEEKDEQNLAILRQKLYQVIEKKYAVMQTKGVYQFHFVLPNNRSFLRVHKPDKFGDNLSNIRKDFAMVNQTRKPLRDLFVGKTAASFRNIFPIFNHNKKYLGAVDISFPTHYIQEELTQTSNLHTHLLTKTTLFKNQVWELGDKGMHYFKSAENEEFLLFMSDILHTKQSCLIDRKKALQSYSQTIKEKMNQNQKFAFYSDKEVDGHLRVLSFYPIVSNLNKTTDAWLVSYKEDDFIAFTLKGVMVVRISFFVLFLLIFYFIYRLMGQKEHLETAVKTKTKELQTQNREQETLLSLFEKGDSVLFKWNNDPEWSINYVSSNVKNLMGYSKEDFLDKKITFAQCIHVDDLQRVIQEVKIGKKSQEEFFKHEPYRIITKEGKTKWVLDYTVLVKDERGKVSHFLGYILDVTRHQEQTQEIERLSKNLSNYLNTIQSILLALDYEGNITLINPEGARILGYEVDELIGKNWLEICLSEQEEREAVFTYFKQIINKEQTNVKYNENFVLTKNGKQKYIAWHNALLSDDAGNIIGVLSSGMDITEQKKLEVENLKKTKELRDSEAFLNNIMESVLDGIVTIDDAGMIQTFNKAAEELFGYKRDEVIHKNVKILIPEPYRREHDTYMQSYLGSDIAKVIGKTIEQEIITKDGASLPVSVRVGETIFDQHRNFTALIQDITEQKAAQEALIEAKEVAEEATKAKSLFLANMSHEIRTPMSGIIGMSHLVLKSELSDKQRNYVKKIHTSANILLGIINDILDISKIEAGKLELEKVHFDLFKVIEGVIHVIELKAHEKELDVIVEYDMQVGKEFVGDSLRINQILLNLLGNALKFTDKGEIGLCIKKAKANRIRFEVHDSGIGLSQDQIKQLFQAFTQADSSTSKKYGGTGLGLAISKQLVGMMNGEIWVESVLGKGSRFIFEIELEQKGKATPYSEFKGKKVLIVDDCQSWLDVIEHMMQAFGFSTQVAYSGAEAIELLSTKPDAFDLILVDWDMPELDGIEICKILKNRLQVDTHKIILISAYREDALMEGIKEAQIEHYLHKPLNPSLLNDLLGEIFLGRVSQYRQSHLRLEDQLIQQIKQLKGSKVLLAEDNEINQELIVGLLEESGIQLDMVTDGLEAVRKYKANSYELILMDIQMPILDGYQAAKEIRTLDKKIPIIALTANAMPEDIEKAELAGMNQHLKKPIEVEKFYQTLLKFIPKKIEPADVGIESPSKEEQLPSFETIDIAYGLKLVMGNVKALKHILQGLVQYKTVNYEAMDDATFKRTMHSLKGLTASVGAHQVNHLAAQMEASLDRAPLKEFKLAFGEIIQEIEHKLQTAKKEQKALTPQIRTELFEALKLALASNRAKKCKPAMEAFERYQLSLEDAQLFDELKALTDKFLFKKALALLEGKI